MYKYVCFVIFYFPTFCNIKMKMLNKGSIKENNNDPNFIFVEF